MPVHNLPDLPYSHDALEPYISSETLEYHHGKHHAGYVEKLNKLIKDSEFADASLEDIIMKASDSIFNNAAQTWNHSFYWNCLSPDGGGEPTGVIADVLDDAFDGYDDFKKQFTESALSNFGSGWTWLVKDRDGRVDVVNTDNAGNPMTMNKQPLLVCDVWEHAYYIDHRNARADYLEAFWKLTNWSFVEANWNGQQERLSATG